MTTPAEAVDSSDNHPATPAGKPESLVHGLVRLARPRQWIKNLLVFVAPGAAGVLLHGTVLWHAAASFGIFCLAASGTYYLNDARDAEADRVHPTKRNRPVAAGVVPVPLALTLAVVMLVASVGLGAWLAGWHLGAVMGAYVAVQLAYSSGSRTSRSSISPASAPGSSSGRWPAAWRPRCPCPTGSSSWCPSVRCWS